MNSGNTPPPAPKDKGHAASGKDHKENNERRVTGDVRVSGEIEANLPPDLVEEYVASSNKTDAREDKRFIVETITLALVVILGIFGGIQSCQAIRGTDTAVKSGRKSEEFFRTDERAWVEIGSIDRSFPNPPQPPFNFLFGFYPKNVGKTVAREVRFNLRQIAGHDELNEEAIHNLQDQTYPQLRSFGAVMVKLPQNSGPETLAPGATSPVPLFTFGFKPYQDGLSPMFSHIYGRIDYIDNFGARHWMRFCYVVVDLNGTLAHCMYGNDEDKNPEPLP